MTRAVRSVSCALAGLLLAGALASPARGAEIGVAQFRIRVDAAIAAVGAARATVADAGVARALASEVESDVPQTAQVVDGGVTTLADTTRLHELTASLSAAGTAKARRDAAAAVAANLASLRAALGGAATTAQPADPAALKALLADRAPSQGDSSTSAWLNEQIDRILRAIGRWFAALQGSGGGAWTLQPVTLVALILLGGIAIFAIARGLIAWRRSVARRDRAVAVGGEGEPVVAAAADLPADALSYADALAAQGRRRDAVRALYGGAARRLVETGVVARMRTRTGGELLRDAGSASPPIVASLADLTERFERAWYGHGEPGTEGYARAKERYADVVGGTGGRGGAADAAPPEAGDAS